MKSDLIDLTVIVHARTERAALVSDAEDGERVWVPLSQCEIEMTGGRVGILTAPEWLLTSKGLV